MSSDKSRQPKAVRFAPSTENSNNDDDDDKEQPSLPSGRPRKRKRDRINEDELDDIDDFQPGDDDGDDDNDTNGAIPSARALFTTKQERLRRRTGGDDYEGDDNTDHEAVAINNRTSLASEGIEIEPFHMDQERSDGNGYFDGDTYVFRRRDDDGEQDAWLEQLDSAKRDSVDQDTTATKQNQLTKDQRQQAQKDRHDDWSESDLFAKLFPNLAYNETVMQALVRYGNLFRQPTGKKSNSRKLEDNVSSSSSSSSRSRQLAQDSFNDITEAANALLIKGKVDIYQMTRADIEKLLPPPTKHKVPSSSSNAAAVQWEYQGALDGKVHGLYTSKQMMEWVQAGYFTGTSAVNVRSVTSVPNGGGTSTTLPVSVQDDLMNDLMDDLDDEIVSNNEDDKVVRGDWMLSDTVNFKRHI